MKLSLLLSVLVSVAALGVNPNANQMAHAFNTEAALATVESPAAPVVESVAPITPVDVGLSICSCPNCPCTNCSCPNCQNCACCGPKTMIATSCSTTYMSAGCENCKHCKHHKKAAKYTKKAAKKLHKASRKACSGC